MAALVEYVAVPVALTCGDGEAAESAVQAGVLVTADPPALTR